MDFRPLCFHEKSLWVCMTCGHCIRCCTCRGDVEIQSIHSKAAQVRLMELTKKAQTPK